MIQIPLTPAFAHPFKKYYAGKETILFLIKKEATKLECSQKTELQKGLNAMFREDLRADNYGRDFYFPRMSSSLPM